MISEDLIEKLTRERDLMVRLSTAALGSIDDDDLEASPLEVALYVIACELTLQRIDRTLFRALT